MAFDQNYIPKELRPINIGQTIAEDSCLLPATTPGRSPDSYPPNSAVTPHGVPFFPPATVSDARFVRIGYGHSAKSTGPAALYSHMPVHIGHQGLNHPAAIGFGYPPNLGNWFGAGNAVDHATGAHYAQNYSAFVDSNGVDQALSDMGSGVGSSSSLVNRVRSSATDQTGNVQPTGTACNNNVADPVAASGVERVNDEAGDDSVSGRKIKFLCSFGGKILPRPGDGMLRYVGGHTRIISVKRDVSFNELLQKMVDMYGQVTVIKYQLPDEDLDSLVSVSCPDDLDNMMEEYEKLRERTSDGSAKLRVFLFSPTEGDPSGMAQFVDLVDCGQKFFNAVNGLADEFHVGITRKDSNTSFVSTQTSDFSGSEFPDHSVHSQGNNVSAAPLSSMSSPREHTLVYHDNNTNAIARDSTLVGNSDVSCVPMDVVASNAGLTQASLLQPDVESGRRVAPLGSTQQNIGLQQPMTEIHVPMSYLHPFVQHQDVINRTEHIQHSQPTVFTHPQPLANGGPGFSRKQFYENIAPLGPNQVVPAMQVAVTPPSSHISTRANMGRPLVQHQQNQLDLYAGEGTYGARLMQLPAEHNYYQVQVPSVVEDDYGWHQVQPPEHVPFSDGLRLHQQVTIPKKFQRLEDNLMCQKPLPHGHSDTLLHDERGSAACSISDVTPVFHSVHLGDKLISPATSGVLQTASPGVGFSPRALNHVGPSVSVSHTGTSGQSQNLEQQQEGGRNFTQKPDVFYDQHNEVTQDMIGKLGNVRYPHEVFLCSSPQLNQDEGQVRGDVLMNKPIINDMSPSSTIAKMSEHAAQESPKEHVSKVPFILSTSEAADNHVTYDQLRPIDGRMKTPIIQHPECYVTNEHNKLSFDISKGGNSDHAPNQVIVKEMLVDNNFGRSEMVFEGNKLKKTDMLPTPYSQSMIRNHHLDFNYDNPSLYAVDPSNIPVQPVEWKDDVRKIHKLITSAAEVISTSVNAPTTSSPSGITGDLQENPNSLFSNQEPWNMQCDSYHPPSRSNKVHLQKEPVFPIDPFSDNHLGNYEEPNCEGKPGDGFYQLLSSSKQDLSSEHSQSDKGSAEEKIKQELQAVAEGVAASVFRSSVHSTSDLQDMSDSTREDIEVENFPNASPDKQRKANTQDADETSEKVYLGFPMLDGVGRLQIIKNSDLEELRELGSGTFGTVYHGKWRGSDVAIKRISNRCFEGKASEQERLRNDFWNEAIKLADLHHPNVVAFYGVVLDGPGGSVATITEFMVNGSLRTALLKNGRCLDMRKLLLIAMDVGFGMEYLHDKNIVHFDLKSDNLLVNLRDPHRPICKVGDLGLSKVKCQTLISGGVRGTLPWMAPELLNGSSSLVSEKVDVFSFGIVMWELLTGEEPYADLHYGAIIGGIVSNTLRPPIPDPCDPELRSLMERCWSSEPSERPSFTEIVNNLRSMVAKIPPKAQILQQQPPPNQSQAQK